MKTLKSVVCLCLALVVVGFTISQNHYIPIYIAWLIPLAIVFGLSLLNRGLEKRVHSEKGKNIVSKIFLVILFVLSVATCVELFLSPIMVIILSMLPIVVIKAILLFIFIPLCFLLVCPMWLFAISLFCSPASAWKSIKEETREYSESLAQEQEGTYENIVKPDEDQPLSPNQKRCWACGALQNSEREYCDHCHERL